MTTNSTEYPTMFHYLLEMHKDGKVLLHMEINVPVESFREVERNTFASLHRLLVDYGVEHGYQVKEALPGTTP